MQHRRLVASLAVAGAVAAPIAATAGLGLGARPPLRARPRPSSASPPATRSSRRSSSS